MNRMQADDGGTLHELPTITLEDFRVFAGSRALLHVEHLALYPGERVVLTGESGSGKSMLLGAIAGRPRPGLTSRGERTCQPGPIGFVPQRGTDALHPLLPIAAQLTQVSNSRGDTVRDTLIRVGLHPALHGRRPSQLSGGQAQRAAVALVALVGGPLLLADEPTSALDPDTRNQLVDLILDVVGTRTLVLTTHDEHVAERVATRRIHMDGGRPIVDDQLARAA